MACCAYRSSTEMRSLQLLSAWVKGITQCRIPRPDPRMFVHPKTLRGLYRYFLVWFGCLQVVLSRDRPPKHPSNPMVRYGK